MTSSMGRCSPPGDPYPRFSSLAFISNRRTVRCLRSIYGLSKMPPVCIGRYLIRVPGRRTASLTTSKQANLRHRMTYVSPNDYESADARSTSSRGSAWNFICVGLCGPCLTAHLWLQQVGRGPRGRAMRSVVQHRTQGHGPALTHGTRIPESSRGACTCPRSSTWSLLKILKMVY
jgi:hypothetical protein